MRGSYRLVMPSGKAWRFHHWVYRNTAYVDDYREFTGALYTYDAQVRDDFGKLDTSLWVYTNTYQSIYTESGRDMVENSDRRRLQCHIRRQGYARRAAIV